MRWKYSSWTFHNYFFFEAYCFVFSVLHILFIQFAENSLDLKLLFVLTATVTLLFSSVSITIYSKRRNWLFSCFILIRRPKAILPRSATSPDRPPLKYSSPNVLKCDRHPVHMYFVIFRTPVLSGHTYERPKFEHLNLKWTGRRASYNKCSRIWVVSCEYQKSVQHIINTCILWQISNGSCRRRRGKSVYE